MVAGQSLLRRVDESPGDEAARDDFLTNFERKYRLEGRPIHRTRFVK
jgi:hypothetical protein